MSIGIYLCLCTKLQHDELKKVNVVKKSPKNLARKWENRDVIMICRLSFVVYPNWITLNYYLS